MLRAQAWTAAAQGVEALVCTSADLADKLARMGILEAHDVHDDSVKVLEALQLPQLQRGVPGGLLRAGHVNIYKKKKHGVPPTLRGRCLCLCDE